MNPTPISKTTTIDCPWCGARNTIEYFTNLEQTRDSLSISVYISCWKCKHPFAESSEDYSRTLSKIKLMKTNCKHTKFYSPTVVGHSFLSTVEICADCGARRYWRGPWSTEQEEK